MDMKKKWGILLSLLSGLLIGWLIWGSQLPQVITKVIQKTTGQVSSTSPEESGANADSSENDDSSNNSNANHTATLLASEELRLDITAADVGMLLSCKISSLEERIQLIGPSDPLAKFLTITPEETSELNYSWRNLSNKIRALQSANTEVTDVDDGSLILNVQQFPEKGKILQTAFNEVVKETLGDARGSAFIDSVKTQTAFAQWGEAPSSFQIAVVLQADDSLLYEIKELKPGTRQYTKKWRAPRMPVHLERLTNFLGISPTP